MYTAFISEPAGGFRHAKAPDEAAAFKTWLREISQKVAEAAVEGSFLGFGGVRVSDAETATLRDISEALGMASALSP